MSLCGKGAVKSDHRVWGFNSQENGSNTEVWKWFERTKFNTLFMWMLCPNVSVQAVAIYAIESEGLLC